MDSFLKPSEHVAKETFLCQLCHKVNTIKVNLLAPLFPFKNKKTPSCEVCGEPFFHKRNQKRHLILRKKKVPNKEKYVCDACGKIFMQEENLSAHLYLHTLKELHSYSEKSNLTSQLKIHTEKVTTMEKYVSGVSGELFLHAQSLSTYSYVHSLKDRSLTEASPTRYSKMNSLKSQLNRHTEKVPTTGKNHVCCVCGELFLCEQTLSTHLYFHRLKDPALTEACPTIYSNMNNLKSQLNTEESCFCCVCGKFCLNAGSLSVHLYNHSLKDRSLTEASPTI